MNILYETSPANRLAGAFGTGLREGINNLTQQKLQALESERSRKTVFPALKALGYKDEEASALSYLDPELLKVVIKNKASQGNDAVFNQALNEVGGAQNLGFPDQYQQYGQPSPEENQPGYAGKAPLGIESQKPYNIQAQQQQQAQQQKADLSKLTADQRLKLEKYKLDREKFDLTKAESERESNKKLEPYLKGKSEDYVNAKKLKSLAEKMRDNLKKNKDKWPSGIGRYIPDVLRSDKDLRKYASDADKLVLELAGSRKGTPTNFKVKLEQSSKPNLSQPYQTQLESLNDIIKSADDSISSYQRLLDIKKQHKGKIPADIREQLLEGEFEAKSDELTQYVGPIAQNDAGAYMKWDPSQNRYRPAKPKV